MNEQEAKSRTAAILVVDDEPGILDLYLRVLSRDYEVFTAKNGLEALEVVRGGGLDLVISDLAMPNLDGVELLRKIRQFDLDLPVILVTGEPTLDSAIQALEYGALRYLTKPFRIKELRYTVQYGVSCRRLAMAKREAFSLVSGRNYLSGDTGGAEAQFESAMETIWLASQPIVSWKQRKQVGREVLLRTDESTLADPMSLFEVAERLGRVHDVGRIVREQAAQKLSVHSDGITVFLNLHHQDLQDPQLFDADAPLSQYSENVVLEITERESLETIPGARDRIKALREMGYRIALDDLGAGHNSLAAFSALEPDIAKLDMLLIRGVTQKTTQLKVIKTMLELGRDLNISFISEGVETEEEREALLSVGCDLFQGYLFGRPRRDWQGPVF